MAVKVRNRPGNPQWRRKDRPDQVGVVLRRLHDRQEAFVFSEAKRIIVRAGRRSGKTVGVGTLAVMAFLDEKRVLYGAPTSEQIDAFWFEVKRALQPAIEAGVFTKQEVTHVIEKPGTKQRIRAKTVWNADTLRGDYADLLILDEWQLMNEDAWDLVGAPMLLDNNGSVVFLYTPPSLTSRSVTKATDPMHAAKLFRKALKNPERWDTFHFTSHDNPHISATALSEISEDMTVLAMRQEIEAEDIDEAPGAQWDRDVIEANRITPEEVPDDLVRIYVSIDPPAESKARRSGCGIMVGGIDELGTAYLLEDASVMHAVPADWGAAVITSMNDWDADKAIGETNHGGEMVEFVLRSIAESISYKAVKA
ncbi:hypothetical protein LCGC14_2348680, partial [marine sediment metagenome]